MILLVILRIPGCYNPQAREAHSRIRAMIRLCPGCLTRKEFRQALQRSLSAGRLGDGGPVAVQGMGGAGVVVGVEQGHARNRLTQGLGGGR